MRHSFRGQFSDRRSELVTTSCVYVVKNVRRKSPARPRLRPLAECLHFFCPLFFSVSLFFCWRCRAADKAQGRRLTEKKGGQKKGAIQEVGTHELTENAQSSQRPITSRFDARPEALRTRLRDSPRFDSLTLPPQITVATVRFSECHQLRIPSRDPVRSMSCEVFSLCA